MAPALPTAEQLRRVFDEAGVLTLGLEEELMLLDPETLDLSPRSLEVLDVLDGDTRFKPELPAAHLEIVTPPLARVPDAIAALAAGRRDLAAAAEGVGRLAAAGVHPFAAPLGVLNGGARYRRTADEYGWIARAQLVCGLQVHVAVGGAERSLAVYNALRAYLPELAALAANAPFVAGRDLGLASVRPKICELLPRQGVPPTIDTWEGYAEALSWGADAGVAADPRRWWWELRPHPAYGTLEIRVPDAQTRIEDAAAVTAFAHALVARLAARHDAGELPPPVAGWRIEENRWLACRDGVQGTLVDLWTGKRRATSERLLGLIETLAPEADRLGCAAELAGARELARENGAMRQRAVAGSEADLRGVAGWLAGEYLGPDARRADA
jgi:carboxylate-amine ligase